MSNISAKINVQWGFNYITKQLVVYTIDSPEREPAIELLKEAFGIEVSEWQDIWFARNKTPLWKHPWACLLVLTKKQAMCLPQIGPIPVSEAY